jgi:tetrapyrrole methylase family protein/MazG family protein
VTEGEEEEMSVGITVIGLGPGSPNLLTVEERDVLESAAEIWVRTRRHPSVAALPGHAAVESFDSLYEKHNSFGTLYREIADRVVELGRRPEGVIYAVPGHPMVGEASVPQIRADAAREGLPFRIVAGVSFIEPVLAAVGVDALENGLQVADATDLASQLYPALDPDRPALIAQLYSRLVAGEVKLTLMATYPDDHPSFLIQAAGTADARVVELPLFEIDRQPWIDDLTSLYLPPRPGHHSLAAFADVVARLRAPDGCPWDREQSHRSLRMPLLEETYEVLSALDREDMEDLREELGDLLMQIVMHAQLASESGQFDLSDVIADIHRKIVHRHPHVFGGVTVTGSAEVLRNWEQIKASEERKRSRQKDPFAGVPPTLPALARAQRTLDKATHLGWQAEQVVNSWGDILSMIGKTTGLDGSDGAADDTQLGEFLLALAYWSRQKGVDAESALREATDRLAARVRDGV